MSLQRQEGFARVYGSPGTRVRFAGLCRMFWPFGIGIAAAGYLVRCAVPVPPVSSVAAGLALLGLVAAGWWLHGHALRRFGRFMKGAQGEELVARELALLPGVFEIYHGLPGAGGEDDFDHVVAGPAGLAVVETKNWSGPVTCQDGELLAQGVRPTRSPVAQVRREAIRLRERLRGQGADPGRVRAVLCFASNAFEEEVLHLDELSLCNVRALNALLLDLLSCTDLKATPDVTVRERLRAAADPPVHL